MGFGQWLQKEYGQVSTEKSQQSLIALSAIAWLHISPHLESFVFLLLKEGKKENKYKLTQLTKEMPECGLWCPK